MRKLARLRTAIAVLGLITGSVVIGVAGQTSKAGAATGGATIVIQTMDSCKQIKGGAVYALTGGSVSLTATTPSGGGSLTSTVCPLPKGSCSAGPCATFTGVPSGTYRINTVKTPPPNTTNPEGYAPCEGGSACRSQVADVTVSGAHVSATVTNVYPDGFTTKFSFSGTSSDPIVFHDFGLAAPGAASNSQCDGDSDADDHLTGSKSGHCAYPEAQESSACKPYPWSCTMGALAPPPPPAHRLQVTLPNTIPAFGPMTVIVTALNSNAVDTGFTGTVTLSSDDPTAVMPAPYAFTAADHGVHSFIATVHRTGDQTVTADGGSAMGPGSATVTVGTDTQSFVENLYHDILGRVGTDAEVAYWVGRLPQIGRSGVAAAFSTSPEVYGRDVTAAYQLMLGSDPDSQGLSYWVDQLEHGNYAESVLAFLGGSQQYYDGHGIGNDKGFVISLYQDILGRTPSDAEVASWTGHGPISDRAGVARAFAFSHEHHLNLVAGATGWYQTYLGRAADPGGAAYWAGQLDHGTHDEVGVASFTGCDEYYAKPAAY